MHAGQISSEQMVEDFSLIWKNVSRTFVKSRQLRTWAGATEEDQMKYNILLNLLQDYHLQLLCSLAAVVWLSFFCQLFIALIQYTNTCCKPCVIVLLFLQLFCTYPCSTLKSWLVVHILLSAPLKLHDRITFYLTGKSLWIKNVSNEWM